MNINFLTVFSLISLPVPLNSYKIHTQRKERKRQQGRIVFPDLSFWLPWGLSCRVMKNPPNHQNRILFILIYKTYVQIYNINPSRKRRRWCLYQNRES